MKGKRWFVSLVAVGVIAVGCGGGQAPTQTTSPAQPAPAAQAPAPAPAPAPAAKTEAPKAAPVKNLGKVSIVQSVETLSFAPMYIAKAKNYFKAEGLDATITVVAGGAEANAALGGKTAQFGAVDAAAGPQLIERGLEVIAVQSNVNRMTMSLVIRKQTAERVGLKRDMPLEERLKKLKGLTIGITGAGAATDTFTRYYLRKVGLEPEKDTKLVSMGGGASLAAALKQGQIDGFQLSPPTPESLEADGSGVVIVSSSEGDVPEFNFPYEVLLARKDYVKENPEVTRAVARAVSRANNFILQKPGEAAKLLEQFFKTEPALLAKALKSVAAAIPKDGLMSKAGWDNLSKIIVDAKQIKAPFDSTEGKYWTNEFLKDLNGLSD